MLPEIIKFAQGTYKSHLSQRIICIYNRASTFALGGCVGPSIAGVLVDHFQFGWASLFVVCAELTVVAITISFIGYRSTIIRQFFVQRGVDF